MGDLYDFEFFRTESSADGVLTVTLDRPKRRNAISPEMHAELAPLLARIAADDSVRVVVITGAGEKAFRAFHAELAADRLTALLA